MENATRVRFTRQRTLKPYLTKSPQLEHSLSFHHKFNPLNFLTLAGRLLATGRIFSTIFHLTLCAAPDSLA